MKSVLTAIICLFFVSTNMQAQSWRDLLNKDNLSNVVNALTGKVDITGSWTYTGSAVKFKSENLFKQAGGAVAANSVEKKLDDALLKAGIKEGVTQFTFNADSTFTSTTNKRTQKGTYSYNPETQIINLKYSRLISYNATLQMQGKKMTLLFDADKLFSLLVFLGNKSTSSALKSVATLAESYDGMMLGLEFSPE